MLPQLLVVVPLTAGFLLVIAYLVWALTARRMPNLQPWHRTVPKGEFRARLAAAEFSLADYLECERRTFASAADLLARRPRQGEALPLGRYQPGGRNDPATFPRNWNRTFEMGPDEPRGGVLLLHGLTDSPYSMRRVAEVLSGQGFYALGLRLPGHGTFPAAIDRISRADWRAAARVGADHVCGVIGRERPFWIAGYSNGGALALQYTLDALDDRRLRRPDRLVLFSPAIGVTRFAALAWWHQPLSFMPCFEKLRWHHVYPEHDPYKYNSFPNNAGFQTHRMLRGLRRSLDRIAAGGRAAELPPVLTFQSLADATVLTEAVADELYARLPANGSELVIFDINRIAYMAGFLATDPSARLARLRRMPDLAFRLTVITNVDRDSRAVMERSWPPGSDRYTARELGVQWPLEVYSLSHVSLVFPPSDPIYGESPAELPEWGVPLGGIEPRGERRLLQVPVELLMRLRYNPFFAYVEERLTDLVREATHGDGTSAAPKHESPAHPGRRGVG
jgi:alpha-beta hydrolase superfamily lysophospholipase